MVCIKTGTRYCNHANPVQQEKDTWWPSLGNCLQSETGVIFQIVKGCSSCCCDVHVLLGCHPHSRFCNTNPPQREKAFDAVIKFRSIWELSFSATGMSKFWCVVISAPPPPPPAKNNWQCTIPLDYTIEDKSTSLESPPKKYSGFWSGIVHQHFRYWHEGQPEVCERKKKQMWKVLTEKPK